MTTRLEQARRDGDLGPGENPAAMARHTWMLRHGLTVPACDGATRDELEESVRRGIAGLFPRT
ncbi:hypothetical protein [Actinoplanes sp. NPDC051494]|uniref:hypothetical protein n=1 Tax=Actinoplanes sp. NPDC051494 TaxID=3363907 RepID=UPI0037BBD48B